jgi:alkylhydroperoxidase/carboxymuconolactone decarboxylase family protein YurZ
MEERERYTNGLEVRRAVLGDAHVDRAMKGRSDFNQEFQELITRYAWGEIWTRPGLPRHTRSLLTIAMMVALNRPDEFRCTFAPRSTMASPATRSRSVAAIGDLLRRSAANSAFHLVERSSHSSTSLFLIRRALAAMISCARRLRLSAPVLPA